MGKVILLFLSLLQYVKLFSFVSGNFCDYYVTCTRTRVASVFQDCYTINPGSCYQVVIGNFCDYTVTCIKTRSYQSYDERDCRYVYGAYSSCNRVYYTRTITFTGQCHQKNCCKGYTGIDCNQVPLLLNVDSIITEAICNGSTSCANGGTCVAPDRCQCAPHYTGPMCKNPLCFGSPVCPNGGKCEAPDKCRCKQGFAGPHCQVICSSNKRWCWPGTCGSNMYASDCKCMASFEKVNTTTLTECQPISKPSISTCQVSAVAPDGTESLSYVGSSDCSLQRDFYGRFQVDHFKINMGAAFIIDTTTVTPRPHFVHDDLFGVTDVSIYLDKFSLEGYPSTIARIDLRNDTYFSHSKPEFSIRTSLDTLNITLTNGERFCLTFNVKGGGYLTSVDVNSDNHITTKVPYQKTETNKSFCYIYDTAAPKHCSESSSCTREPLKLSTKVTSSRQININIEGWNDPLPINSSKFINLASGIKSFTIEIYEVISSTTSLQMRDTSAKRVITINSAKSGNDTEIELPAKNPMLYALVLEVTDFANNVRHARRFVLYDNTSRIKINPNFPLRVTTASDRTNFKWQINHEQLCYNWTKRYFNNHYKKNDPFRPIIRDKYDITGNYDQIAGILSINGTENIHGLNGFYFSVLQNDNNVISGQVENFTSEALCIHPAMNDGDVFTLMLQATDIMNHTLNDSVSVYIDQSVPEIADIWLTRRGKERLYVHHSTDLSKMFIQFKAFDVHSGIREIKWAFGTYENNTVLIEKSLGVTSVDNAGNSSTTYCPKIGNCSQMIFGASLSKLANTNNHRGLHNKRYFFTIEAMNSAFLKAFDHIDILVDDSPPEVGVVLEGSSHDIDYTSNNEVTISWHDFIDHESGIMMYKVALGSKCFDNLDNLKPGTGSGIAVKETVHNSIKLPFSNGQGQYFVSLVAYNNALSPSKVVCSDGVTFDKSFPNIANVSVKHAIIKQSVGCLGGEAWLIKENLVKVPLHSAVCSMMCRNKSDDNILKVIPLDNKTKDEDFDLPNFICQQVPLYNSSVIYVPTDQLDILWETSDDRTQIDGVYIGFGRDKTSIDNPSIMGYKKVNHYSKYSQRHPGLIGEETFYIFIKVVNKAGLYNKIYLGPILADETPPVCPASIQPVIKRKNVVIKWTNTEVADTEQNGEIGKVLFRFVVGDRYVTSFLEWNIENENEKCDLDAHCIDYPMKVLQKYDSKEGSEFFAELHFYNYAGHFCSVTSLPFRLPSLFPPGPGEVLDVLPSISFIHQDVDIIFESNQFCVAWVGFDHHQNIELELGLGTFPTNDSLVKFHKIHENSSKYVCEQYRFDDENQKYFVTLKASCQGGTTFASSDGFFHLKQSAFLSQMSLYYGKDCLQTGLIDTKYDGINEIDFVQSLDAGKTYSIFSSTNMTLQNDDVKILKASMFSGYFVTTLLTLKEIKSINITSHGTGNHAINSTTIKTFQCNPFKKIQSSQHIVAIHWTLKSLFAELVSHFEVALCKYQMGRCKNNLHFVNAGKATYFNFTGNFQVGTYKSFIRPCFGQVCLAVVPSDEFLIRSPPNETIDFSGTGTVDNVHLKVTVAIKQYSCGDMTAQAYRWALFTNDDDLLMLSDWKYTADYGGKGGMVEDNVEIDSRMLPYKHGLICVEAFCGYETETRSCSPLNYSSDPNTFEKDILYDLNLNDPFIKELQKYRHSSNIGSKVINVQRHEMDFADKNVRIGGFIIGRPNIPITWYLTKKRQVPTTLCSFDDACLYSVNTTGGFIDFNNPLMKNSQILYICAVSSDFKICSNGFLVDDSFPTPGVVGVDTYNDYVIDGTQLSVSWKGFTWNKDALKLGYLSDIAGYSYAIGTYKRADDVRLFTSVGMSTSVTVYGLDLKPGKAYFVTIRAYNHVNTSVDAYSKHVVIDTSPPTFGIIEISNNHGYVATHTILLRWFGIDDSESGIGKVEVGIGSHNNSVDSIPYRECVEFAEINGEGQLKDGHKYFAIIRATNGAGLQSYTTSPAFVVDNTPPRIGHVMETSTDAKTEDIDFQSEGTVIRVSWYGFTDPHSEIKFYKVALGTSPYDDDVVTFTNVGLQTSMLWQKNFINGVRYYTTVMACNGADLCSTATSNGVVIDMSPPVPGLVVVGSSGTHSRYQSNRKTVHAMWIGFQDPHSDLDHFDVCIGTSKLSCEVMSPKNVQLTSAILIPNLNLTVGIEHFVTVSACNKVKMCTKRHSEGFIIDDTVPKEVTKPYILDLHMKKYKNITLISDPSFIKVYWRFEDNESPIVKTSISVKSKNDTHTPVNDVIVAGLSEYAVNLLQNETLRLGDVYSIQVTACNAADMCTTSYSDEILVDWTPPQIGGFMPPMKYDFDRLNENLTLYLSWYGFYDVQSDIVSYHISIGYNYSTTEIIENYQYLPTGYDDIENHKITTTNKMLPDEIVLTIYAVNGAGLFSMESKVTVDVVPSVSRKSSGQLIIQRHSCPMTFCNEDCKFCDCTCSVVGQKCSPHTDDMCITGAEKQTRIQNPNVNVTMISLSNNRTWKATGSSKCLYSQWENLNNSVSVLRYEFSFGKRGSEVGEGVYNLSSENPWHDVGNKFNAFHCLPNGDLSHGIQYVAYVRAWISPRTFVISSSTPVIVDHVPPVIHKRHPIIDSSSSCLDDIDYISSYITMYGCWAGVFSDEESGILEYQVSLGTSKGIDDVVPWATVGTVTQIAWSGLPIKPGTRYYTNVIAINKIGLQTDLSSDGFLLDNDLPTEGVVFNTKHHSDKIYQSGKEPVIFSWHGFDDEHSFISHYEIAFEIYSSTTNKNMSLPFTEVGNMYQYKIPNQLFHGDVIKAYLKAVDAAGHESNIVMSEALRIDDTSPESLVCNKFDVISTMYIPYIPNANSTISITAESVILKKNDMLKMFIESSSVEFDFMVYLTLGEMTMILPYTKTNKNTAVIKHNYVVEENNATDILIKLYGVGKNAFVHINISKCIDLSITNATGNLILVDQISEDEISVCVQAIDNESEIRKMFVSVGSTVDGQEISAMHPLPLHRHDVIKGNFSHGMTVYVSAMIENHAGLSTFSTSKPLVIDMTSPILTGGTVQAVYSHDDNTTLTLIKAVWAVRDVESEIVSCDYCMGSSSRLCDVFGFKPTPTFEELTSEPLRLHHGSVVYVTVRCVNSVQLSGAASLGPLVISYLPPDSTSSLLHVKTTECNKDKTQNITVSWDGFAEPAGISVYSTQLSSEKNHLIEWVSVGKKNYLEARNIDGNNLDRLTFEVRAENVGGLSSKAINGTVLTDCREPLLTGSLIELKYLRDKMYKADFGKVFKTEPSVTIYEVSIGSNKGTSDVIMPTTLRTDTIDFLLPVNVNEVYVVVTGYTSSGQLLTYRQFVTM